MSLLDRRETKIVKETIGVVLPMPMFAHPAGRLCRGAADS